MSEETRIINKKTRLLDRTSIHAASALRSKEAILEALDDLTLILGTAISTNNMETEGAMKAVLYSEALWWVLGIDADPFHNTLSPAANLINKAAQANLEMTSLAERQGINLAEGVRDVLSEASAMVPGSMIAS
ncbi:MAG: hypothetical protein K2Z81_05760 [Cyanobacteria bacterium]|nr:hypothetical protein [Cyanobacteriota bacterium]